MDEEILKKLALLKMLKENADADDEDEDDLFVSSVNNAYDLLTLHMTMRPAHARFRKKLIDYIVDPEHNVLGDPDVYHNLIMALFHTGDFLLALKVCDFVLERAPEEADMLADAIKACGDSCRFELGEKYLDRAERMGRELWNWRLFLYAVDFLKSRLNAYRTDNELCEKALSLAEDYINRFPKDEHGYNQKAEILIIMNRRQEAQDELYNSIFNAPSDEKDEESSLVAAQCCTTMLQLLDDSTDYDLIISVCDRGLRSTTQEQPSSKIGYFMYRRAMALDARAHKDGFRSQDDVREALECYQAAYDLNRDRDYGRTIEQRYAVLRIHAKEFVPLVRRPLFVDEDVAKD